MINKILFLTTLIFFLLIVSCKKEENPTLLGKWAFNKFEFYVDGELVYSSTVDTECPDMQEYTSNELITTVLNDNCEIEYTEIVSYTFDGSILRLESNAGTKIIKEVLTLTNSNLVLNWDKGKYVDIIYLNRIKD